MNKKILIGILSSTLLLSSSFVAHAIDSTENSSQIQSTLSTSENDFEFSDGVITKYLGTEKDVVIPATINGEAVTTIGYSAFSGNQTLETLIISEGITSLEQFSFRTCRNLSIVTLPSSLLTIGDSSFEDCTSLSTINIPNSVEKIGDYTFSGCESLVNMTIPDSVTDFGGWVFRNCSSLEAVTLSEHMTEIGESAFENCTALTSVTIPDSVIMVYHYAFKNCTSLLSVENSKNLEALGKNAFENCSKLNSFSCPLTLTSIFDTAFQGSAFQDIFYEGTDSQWNLLDSDGKSQFKSYLQGTTIHFGVENTTGLLGVTMSPWAVDHMEKANSLNLITQSLGTDYTAFINRQQIAEILVNMVEKYTETTLIPASSSTFVDTSEVSVLKAFEAGIITGMEDGYFSPDSNATREQIAVMMYKAIEVMEESLGETLLERNSSLDLFGDWFDASWWAKNSMAILANNGILTGVGENQLAPKSLTTIEQCLVMNNALYLK